MEYIIDKSQQANYMYLAEVIEHITNLLKDNFIIDVKELFTSTILKYKCKEQVSQAAYIQHASSRIAIPWLGFQIIFEDDVTVLNDFKISRTGYGHIMVLFSISGIRGCPSTLIGIDPTEIKCIHSLRCLKYIINYSSCIQEISEMLVKIYNMDITNKARSDSKNLYMDSILLEGKILHKLITHYRNQNYIFNNSDLQNAQVRKLLNTLNSTHGRITTVFILGIDLSIRYESDKRQYLVYYINKNLPISVDTLTRILKFLNVSGQYIEGSITQVMIMYNLFPEFLKGE